MKIKSIKICGFRGIPPVDPPDVDIDLSSKTDYPKNLLLFAPNAYGKSSIADALEWFFKENVRGSDCFAEYCDRDNIHVMLGQPEYQSEAYIELVIEHDGSEHVVRKTLDGAGNKTNETLGKIQALLQELEDEIIVLDHDQFRKFISSANTEKWTTFSSLIGFEELDNFRAGIDSLSQRSLTDYLHHKELESNIKNRRRNYQESLQKVIQTNQFNVETLEELKAKFQTLLEITLTSLSLPSPSFNEINNEFWNKLFDQISAAESVQAASIRLGELNTILGKLSTFSDQAVSTIENLNDQAASLNEKKDNFDKELLAEFYNAGLKIIKANKSEQGLCPFCQSIYDWEHLVTEVSNRNDALDFDTIQKEYMEFLKSWEYLKSEINSRRHNLSTIELSSVKAGFEQVDTIDDIDNAISLQGFNLQYIQDWIGKIIILAEVLRTSRETVQREIAEVTETIRNNPRAELQQTVDQLNRLWNNIETLTNDLDQLVGLEIKLEVMNQVIENMRSITRNFRNELNDFSGRVIEIINDDVENYYEELHPDDNVHPYLNVTVIGNQRIVDLQCDYKGVPNRAAVTLLSESHRNSLGLAILLAFMKYKRQNGSPVGFCIFDDVTQSFDVEHRTNLINLLENQIYPEISGQQIIFMTHDRTLADLIKRPTGDDIRKNWIRMDIRHWWIERMLIESEHDQAPLSRAQFYIDQHDEIAASIYVRRGLEQLYKKIIEKTQIRIPFSEKPWSISLNSYRNFIIREIQELWEDGKGFINPNENLFHELFTSQRILNLTVHDSQFLDNPLTLGDVKNAYKLVQELESRFTCKACNKFYHTVRLDKNGNNPQCRDGDCNNLLS